MYMNELKDIVGEDQEIWKACLEEINKRREIRHSRVMERQIKKFNKLSKNREDQIQGGCSKHQSDHSKEKEKGPDKVKKWVINLLSVPLTKDQEDLLAHGPNFAITPKKPPLGEYITNIEKACQSLDVNSARRTQIRYLQGSETNTPSQTQHKKKGIRSLETIKRRQELHGPYHQQGCGTGGDR